MWDVSPPYVTCLSTVEPLSQVWPGWALISLSNLSQTLHCWPALSFHFDQNIVKPFYSFNVVRNCQILLRWGQRAKVTIWLRTTALGWPCFSLLWFLKSTLNPQRVDYFFPSSIQGGNLPCCYSHVFWKLGVCLGSEFTACGAHLLVSNLTWLVNCTLLSPSIRHRARSWQVGSRGTGCKGDWRGAYSALQGL